MNLAKAALQPGLATPDRLAFSVLGLSRADRWSHARLRAAVLAMAGALRASGLQDGDCLPLPPKDEPAFAVTFLAAIAAGLVPDLTASCAPQPPAPAQAAAGFQLGAAAETAWIGPEGPLAPRSGAARPRLSRPPCQRRRTASCSPMASPGRRCRNSA